MSHFEEVNSRERFNSYYKRKTVPFNDFDLLQRMIVMQEADATITKMQLNLGSVKDKISAVDYKERLRMIESLYHLFQFCGDIWDEGNYQFKFGYNCSLEISKLKNDNLSLKKEVDKLTKVIKESLNDNG